MVTPVDPNQIRLTGENSFIRLGDQEGAPYTTQASHWRILLSPAGPGHALFLQSDVTDNQVRIYSDNIQLARWLQEEIEIGLNAAFADLNTPVAEATFSREGDIRFYSTEKVVSRDTDISLTWYDIGEPFLIRLAPGDLGPTLAHGVYSVLTPADNAQLALNGRTARGRSLPDELAGQKSRSCCLAWSETWLRPR